MVKERKLVHGTSNTSISRPQTSRTNIDSTRSSLATTPLTSLSPIKISTNQPISDRQRSKSLDFRSFNNNNNNNDHEELNNNEITSKIRPSNQFSENINLSEVKNYVKNIEITDIKDIITLNIGNKLYKISKEKYGGIKNMFKFVSLFSLKIITF